MEQIMDGREEGREGGKKKKDFEVEVSIRLDSDFVTLDQLVPFDNLPPLLFPSPHPDTCSAKFC